MSYKCDGGSIMKKILQRLLDDQAATATKDSIADLKASAQVVNNRLRRPQLPAWRSAGIHAGPGR